MSRPSWPWRAGEALDEFLNVVLFDGDVGDTISDHSAKAQAAGKTWGCIVCRWLSLTVQKDHCKETLAGQPISQSGGILAGTQLLALFLILTGLGWFFILR